MQNNGYPSNDFVVEILKNVFSKTNDKNYQMGLGKLCDILSIYLQKYTIFSDGVGRFYEDDLKNLLFNNGYKLKEEYWLKLKPNYLTLKESGKFLGKYMKDSISETEHKNYNSLDLIAYHGSNNGSLFDDSAPVFFFPYILYTDKKVGNSLDGVKKFKLNDFSVIHYKVMKEKIRIISFYVKPSKRKNGYERELLLEFFSSMNQQFPKFPIEFFPTTDVLEILLSKLIKEKKLKYVKEQAILYKLNSIIQTVSGNSLS
ncbi:MAG: hypothetical protein A2540_03800 [Sulfurimonas sp. RIFOXYD2_FULL_37_8]|jgi:hypothetical protein|nr:MAG: hypothetical protein A2540_03800 [Sulfurimonas sp. RIFOXYD2_FULL_37_8]